MAGTATGQKPKPAPASAAQRKPSPGPEPTTLYGAAAAAPKAPVAGSVRQTAQSDSALSPQTRILPRHVYENRQNTTNVSVPKGYRPVWTDDRLNPRRAERTARAAQVSAGVVVPRGYQKVRWDDDRLNPNRGGTARGDAQTDLIWTREIPRRLVPASTLRVAALPEGAAPVQDPQTRVTRLSTRSAPEAAKIYVRAADFDDKRAARRASDTLAGSGVPVRLGILQRSGRHVVLAGPYASDRQARAALAQLRAAGYRRARLLK